MGIKWTDASDRDLLLCIVAESQVTATKWNAIAARMQDKGHEFSGGACSQHFAKLRKDSEGGSGSPSDDSPNAKTGSGKAKAKKSARPAVGTGRKRKNLNEGDGENEDDDEQFDYPTPAKKQKLQGPVKQEEGGGEGEGFEEEKRPIIKYETIDDNGDNFVDLEDDGLYLDAPEF